MDDNQTTTRMMQEFSSIKEPFPSFAEKPDADVTHQEPNPSVVRNDKLMLIMERLATDPNVDVTKLEKMIQLQERIFERDSRVSFAADFAAMKSELPIIPKTKRNQVTNSDYAPIDVINKLVDPVLAAYGFATTFRVAQDSEKNTITATCILMHSGGHSQETTVTVPLDDKGAKGTINKTGVHAVGSSISYVKRYAKAAALDLATGDDDDGNAAGQRALTEYQQDQIKILLEKCSDETRDKFRERFGSIALVPQHRYTEVLMRLQAQAQIHGQQKGSIENANI